MVLQLDRWLAGGLPCLAEPPAPGTVGDSKGDRCTRVPGAPYVTCIDSWRMRASTHE